MDCFSHPYETTGNVIVHASYSLDNKQFLTLAGPANSVTSLLLDGWGLS
jgi:hypothetical protein